MSRTRRQTEKQPAAVKGPSGKGADHPKTSAKVVAQQLHEFFMKNGNYQKGGR